MYEKKIDANNAVLISPDKFTQCDSWVSLYTVTHTCIGMVTQRLIACKKSIVKWHLYDAAIPSQDCVSLINTINNLPQNNFNVVYQFFGCELIFTGNKMDNSRLHLLSSETKKNRNKIRLTHDNNNSKTKCYWKESSVQVN